MTDDEKIQAEVGRIMALPDHEQVDAIVPDQSAADRIYATRSSLTCARAQAE